MSPVFGVGIVCSGDLVVLEKSVSSLLEHSSLPFDVFLVNNFLGPECTLVSFCSWITKNCSDNLVGVYIVGCPKLDESAARNILLEKLKAYRFAVVVGSDVCYTLGWMEYCAAVFTTFPEVAVLSLVRTDKFCTKKIVWRYGISICLVNTISGVNMVFEGSRYVELGCPKFSSTDNVCQDICDSIDRLGLWLVSPAE